MVIYGTRPEAIKVAPVIKALQSSEVFECLAVVTGQHRSMLDQVNTIFEITPDADLDIFEHGQSLTSIMARALARLDAVLEEHHPDAVLVQGDTSTSTAGALAAFYRQIPVVHLEAGLRSGSIASPFPEEANRKITTQVAALHLAPTEQSRNNLIREGVDPASVAVTGNSVIDALLETVKKGTPFTDPQLEEIASSNRPVLLVTTHRRENWGPAMESIGRAIARLADRHPAYSIVVPLHHNPLVRQAMLPQIAGKSNVTVTEPLPYGEFTRLIEISRIVLTDSGGVQEEAPSLGKPVLVMRENTERPEAVEAGTVMLIGTAEDRIVAEVTRLINDEDHFRAMANAVNPYGDGRTSERTVAAIAQLLGLGTRLADFQATPRAQVG